MLIVFSGLPGTGKTTIARLLAASLGATYLRIDSVEQVIRDDSSVAAGPVGYEVAMALAADNLALGGTLWPIALIRSRQAGRAGMRRRCAANPRFAILR